MHSLDLLRHVLLFLLLTVALYTDLAHGRVDNPLAFGGIALGLLCQGLSGGWGSGLRPCLLDPAEASLMNALLGAGIAAAVFLPLAWMGGIGGGDLKLMTAVGALAGLRVTIHAMFLASAVGAALAVGLLVLKGRLREGLSGTWRTMLRLGRPALPLAGEAPAERLSIRYVPAIAAGTLWAWYSSHA